MNPTKQADITTASPKCPWRAQCCSQPWCRIQSCGNAHLWLLALAAHLCSCLCLPGATPVPWSCSCPARGHQTVTDTSLQGKKTSNIYNYKSRSNAVQPVKGTAGVLHACCHWDFNFRAFPHPATDESLVNLHLGCEIWSSPLLHVPFPFPNPL